MIEALVNDYDKSYLRNQTAEDDRETLLPLNSILEKCRINSLTDFNDQNNFHNPSTNSIMCKFLNIDGNAANFDSLLTTLQVMKSDFSIIGLAETNIDSSISETYKIPQYNSVYLNKINDKKKGSGVAMYIHDSIDFNTNETMSKCNSDIESLFISINSTEIPIHIGTVYHPPSGDLKKFFYEFKNLLSSFDKKDKVIIMGNFNINMFNDNKHRTSFEETILCLLPQYS